jgi:hypothetical protein
MAKAKKPVKKVIQKTKKNIVVKTDLTFEQLLKKAATTSKKNLKK